MSTRPLTFASDILLRQILSECNGRRWESLTKGEKIVGRHLMRRGLADIRRYADGPFLEPTEAGEEIGRQDT